MRAKNELQQLSEAYQNVLNEGEEKPDPLDDHSSVEAYRAARGIPMPSDEEGKRFRLVGVGGEHSQIENVEGEFDTIDELIDSIDLPEEYGNEWVEEIKDPSNWSAEGFEDGLIRFGIGEIYEVIDTQSAEDDEGWGRVAKGALLSSLLGKGAITGGLAGAAYHALKGETPKKEEKKEEKKKRGSWSGANYEDEEDRDREKPGGSNAGDYPNVDKSDFCGPAGGAPEGSYPVNSEKRARAALSYAHNAPDPEGIKRCVYKKAKEHGWFDEEDEEFRYSPMLDSHQSDTSGYLTEQVAKDKRNKIKPRTENQSFKERYKPSTHWQLQELKRRGL